MEKAPDAVDIWERVLGFHDIDDCYNRIVAGFLDLICPTKCLHVCSECQHGAKL